MPVIGKRTAQCYGFQNFKSGEVERSRSRYLLSIEKVETISAYVAYFQRKIPIIRIFCITGWIAVPIFPNNWSSVSMDALPTNRTWPPSCSHGTYQHKAITSRSRQLLMMGTWLPETCWATIRREIKNTKSDI